MVIIFPDGESSHNRENALELDPSATIGPQLHAILREKVVRNELPPGARLSEAEIGRQFGISRQPVREAFIKLAEEGLIEIRPQRGTIVRRIDPAMVIDARFVREAVEADIVRLLAASPDPALVTELRHQIETQRRFAREAPQDFIRADEHFHRTLARSAGKEGAWEIMQGPKSQMDRVRFLSFGLNATGKLIDQHIAIIDRIEQADVAGADLATRTHLRAVLEDLPELMRANPDAFTGTPETLPET